MSKTRYENMTGGYTEYEAGRVLGLTFREEARAALAKAGIRPCGGTLDRPRYPRLHVDQLAAIRRSHEEAKPR